MTDVMRIFIVREIQLFKVKFKKISLIFLTKIGSSKVLAHIMPFIKPHRHEKHHISKLIS